MKVKELIAFLSELDPEMDCYSAWETEDDGGYDLVSPSVQKLAERYPGRNHVYCESEAKDWTIEAAIRTCGAEMAPEALERCNKGKAKYRALPWRDVVIF